MAPCLGGFPTELILFGLNVPVCRAFAGSCLARELYGIMGQEVLKPF